jgi:hypothetical protein
MWLLRGRPPGVGAILDAPISVVPEDAERLGCVLPYAVGAYRCEYADDFNRFAPPPTPGERVQPFVTTEHDVYLVPGLFTQPAIAAFSAGHRGVRFVARCRVRLLARVPTPRIRFQPTDGWDDSKDPAWLAEPVSCVAE